MNTVKIPTIYLQDYTLTNVVCQIDHTEPEPEHGIFSHEILIDSIISMEVNGQQLDTNASEGFFDSLNEVEKEYFSDVVIGYYDSLHTA